MISAIIPTYNEVQIISGIITRLLQQGIEEIIVSDGGSTDGTTDAARLAGATVITSEKGRAAQMNAGVAIAKGELLYFLHADTFPAEGFVSAILQAVNDGYNIGCFTLKFDVDHWFLKANAWFTRFNLNAFRFGDQSLFVRKDIFIKAGGFNDKLIMLEDQEIIKRLRKHGKFIVINNPVTTSSRKYLKNGIYKTQAVYFLIYILYRLGISQQRLLKLYRKLIVQDKL